MCRIEGTDSVMSAVTKLADGNPGAISAMMAISEGSATIDPDSKMMGPFAPLLSLDTMGIYGPDIWMLYSDVCGTDIPQTLAVLRSYQLGIVDLDVIKTAIQSWGQGLDLCDVLAKVKERLPAFCLPE